MAGRKAKVRLHVALLCAKNLRAADIGLRGGNSDPYATCTVQGRQETQIKTLALTKTLDPVWNHTGVIEKVKVGDPLEFCVFDHDKIGDDDLLGKYLMESEEFYPNGFSGIIDLQDTRGKPSTLQIKIDVLPIMFDEEDIPRVLVKIDSADGLKGADWGGKSDPYVICRIPGKRRSHFRTKVLMSTVTPVWDEEDELEGFELGDDIEFIVFDWDRKGKDDELGRVRLTADEFMPDGYRGDLKLKKGTLRVDVDLYIPAPPKPTDPGEHVTRDHRKPAPFQLRCMDTGRTHRVYSYTVVGRSKTFLDPRYDLVLNSPGIGDISRVEHAVIKAWCGVDPSKWSARVYPNMDKVGAPGPMGAPAGPCAGPGGGNMAGGISVDNEPVVTEIGLPIEKGSVIRFGVREMWTLEHATLYHKSQVSTNAMARANLNVNEDTAESRELRVPSGACQAALQHCTDWDSLVRVVLEWCGDPDEPPCVDIIEVLDECGAVVGRHDADTLEDQERYDVKAVLQEVRMGCTIRLHLSCDPTLLAPILRKLDLDLKTQADLRNARGAELFSGFG